MPCHTEKHGVPNVSRITFLTFVLASTWVLVGFAMFQECSAVRKDIRCGQQFLWACS